MHSGRSTATAPTEGRTDASDARLGFVLLLMVGTFAFLLASFPARNTDIALHLSQGKQWIDSRLSDLGDPIPIGNRSTWLYDLFCYGVFSVVGGGGLVAVKAMLVVGLAAALLRLNRIHGWWIPAACTALALLAMGLRLGLQPATFSYLLFAAELSILRERDTPMSTWRPAAWRSATALLLLFVLWVNFDGWFQLGLLTVACFALGRPLDEPGRGNERVRSMLWGALALAALVAACLLNPRGWRAFVLIPELKWLVRPATLPELLATGQVLSPFHGSYWASFGRSPAGLAYYPLLGLSLLSFLLTARQPRWRWLLPWLALALLSALQVRVIPFFAMLAAAVAAWNLQEFFAARRDDSGAWERPYWRRGLWALRALTVVLGLAFLLCAWPGWLQLPPYEPRRWAIELPPALVQSAQTCQRWQHEGKFAAGAKALHLSQETAHVFAWHCAEEKGIRDDNLASLIREAAAPNDDLHERLRAAAVDRVIV